MAKQLGLVSWFLLAMAVSPAARANDPSNAVTHSAASSRWMAGVRQWARQTHVRGRVFGYRTYHPGRHFVQPRVHVLGVPFSISETRAANRVVRGRPVNLQVRTVTGYSSLSADVVSSSARLPTVTVRSAGDLYNALRRDPVIKEHVTAQGLPSDLARGPRASRR